MCLSDLGTAVLIGGEGVNQHPCKDALWKLEIGRNFKATEDNRDWGLRTTHVDGRGSSGVCARGGVSKGVTPPSMVNSG